MRFIQTKTYELKEFGTLPSPQYAVLSHTWLQSEPDRPDIIREITYQDMQNHLKKIKDGNYKTQGWAKLKSYCNLAAEDGWEYAWMDTCCIDKTNPADTQEAINAMFRWYHDAGICYAHLDGVNSKDLAHNHEKFRNARWFERGWTLQELLAPLDLMFVDQYWKRLGTKGEWIEDVAAACRMSVDDVTNFDRCSLAAKLSWASHRKTTLKEDEAYCLLGLFGISMPLCYGEDQLAFRRFQIELIKVYEDPSIFAWSTVEGHFIKPGVLAPSPACFSGCGNVKFPLHRLTGDKEGHQLDNRGLTITAPIFQGSLGGGVLWLNCYDGVGRPNRDSQIGIQLTQAKPPQIYKRGGRLGGPPIVLYGNVKHQKWEIFPTKTILIEQPSPTSKPSPARAESRLVFEKEQVMVLEIYSDTTPSWDGKQWFECSKMIGATSSQSTGGGHESILIKEHGVFSQQLVYFGNHRILEVETLDKRRFAVFLILNRFYTPLGCLVREWEDLEDPDGKALEVQQSSNTDAIQVKLRPVGAIPGQDTNDASSNMRKYIVQMSLNSEP